ncbi:MAG TPA: hypothetical protein VFH88_00150, partial [Candidatus Krumholzibacteria bacterium]|nr:hypothetical protein [Candidatus Krumholzibacteria bacterium]
MIRKLWIFGIVAIFGLSAAVAGVRSTRTANACDDNAKTASVTHSCCAQGNASEASVDAKTVHKNVVRSAMFAPGASPALNVAAFAGMTAGSNHTGCEWCPEGAMTAGCSAHMSSADCAAQMSSAECASKMSGASQCPFMAQQTGMSAD